MSRYIDADKLKPKTRIYSDLDDNFHEKEYYREYYYDISEIENAPNCNCGAKMEGESNGKIEN